MRARRPYRSQPESSGYYDRPTFAVGQRFHLRKANLEQPVCKPSCGLGGVNQPRELHCATELAVPDLLVVNAHETGGLISQHVAAGARDDNQAALDINPHGVLGQATNLNHHYVLNFGLVDVERRPDNRQREHGRHRLSSHWPG